MDMMRALDTALHGKLCVDLNKMLIYRILNDPTRKQGASTQMTVLGTTGKYRIGGHNVTINSIEESAMFDYDGVTYVLPYEKGSVGWTLWRDKIDLRVVQQAVILSQMNYRMHQLAMDSRVQSVDEIREELRVTAENLGILASKAPGYNLQNLPSSVGRISESERLNALLR